MKTIYHKGTKRAYYMHDIDADNALATGLYQDSPVLAEEEKPVEMTEIQGDSTQGDSRPKKTKKTRGE